MALATLLWWMSIVLLYCGAFPAQPVPAHLAALDLCLAVGLEQPGMLCVPLNNHLRVAG